MHPHDDDCKELKKALDAMLKSDLDPKLEECLERQLNQFRRNLPEHPVFHPYKSAFFSFPMDSLRQFFHGWKLVWTAGGLVILLILINVLLFSQSSPTWADVARQFQSVPYCYATVYFKENPLAKTIQYELWMGKGGKIRIHYNKQVIFADHDGLQHAYDVVTRHEEQPDDSVLHIINSLKSKESFSLEMVIQSLAKNISKLRPEPIPVEAVSGDLSIFTLTDDNSPEWIRIWTLRESQLPIFLRKFNPKTAETLEVVFSYQTQQSEPFFDYKKFKEILTNPSYKDTDLLYAFFEDPSRLPITPEN